jgi:hypothetical protein
MDFFLMILIVAKRIEDLGKCQVRELLKQVFWAGTLAPIFNQCPHSDACAENNGLTVANP